MEKPSGATKAQQLPRLSVIVIAYRMSRQLENTLKSLQADYQTRVQESHYEVIVVENPSDDQLPESVVAALPSNFHYFLQEQQSESPVDAINFAFQQCRSDYIGLLVDGARLLTPGILANALDARKMHPCPLVAVPGYHIGEAEQHVPRQGEDLVAEEQAMLEQLNWCEDGYRLFSAGVICGANPKGYFQPLMESNCLFANADLFQRIGYADTRFSLPGGGSINLHMFRMLGLQPDVSYFVLPGEGTFHQYHGGVTTSDYPEREVDIKGHLEQLQGIWKGTFKALSREPVILGAVSKFAQPMLQFSAQMAEKRARRLAAGNLPLWEDDLALAAGRQFIPETSSIH